MKRAPKSKIPFVVFFGLFLILILLGIWMKRHEGHSEWVIFFHLPAAFFLVMAAMQMKGWNQAVYDEEIRKIRGNPSDSENSPL